MSRNITEVHLLNVPLENDLTHTLYFESLEAQTSYFYSKRVKSGSNFSYQRKEKIIRYPSDYDELIGCNYVMYKNSAYSNKWYYAFITRMEYVNDGRTDIYIETDVIQTWLFDYNIKQSFVEREHVSDDTVGFHTVPECLEKGEFISNSHTVDENLTNENVIVFGRTASNDGERAKGKKYNGIYSGLEYIVCDTPSGVDGFLDLYDMQGIADSVQCMFIAPMFIAYPKGGSPIATGVPESDSVQSYNVLIEKWKTLNGYTPRNNKLLTKEFNCLYVSNNNGAGTIYGYEDFKEDESANFIVQGALCPGCSIRLIPLRYKGAAVNDEEGLNLGKFPICNWTSDVYTNWLTQNSVNIGVSVASGIGTAIGGIGLMATGMGAMMGAATSMAGVQSIASTVGEMYARSVQPIQAQGNLNCGDVITSAKRNTFHFYRMSIKSEYAKIIDGYMDMFGYKVNMMKTPEKAHRENYWYTKCIDVNIDGAIPMEDMRKIKECYNRGITFWRNAANIQNYSVDNGIV